MRELSQNLADILQHDPLTGLVIGREGKRREYKRAFTAADFSDYTKALAAFSNTEGGILIFGISDRPREISGINLQTLPDEAQWADRLKEEFDPEIVITTRTYNVRDLSVFAIAVNQSQHRPIICRKTRTKRVVDRAGVGKDVEVLREGTIYFRYAAQTRAIGFTELAAMLDDREKRRMKKILEALQVVDRVGFDKAGVIDLTRGATSNVYVSRETAKDLTFINRANLVEDKAAPAYLVLGQVQLNNIVHAPLQEADKNLPTEAAAQLRPLVKEIYGDGATISAQQVTKILKHLKIGDDEKHCIHEKKLRRKYITRAGIQAVASFIGTNPLDAIRVFGARHAIARYEQQILVQQEQGNAAA